MNMRMMTMTTMNMTKRTMTFTTLTMTTMKMTTRTKKCIKEKGKKNFVKQIIYGNFAYFCGIGAININCYSAVMS